MTNGGRMILLLVLWTLLWAPTALAQEGGGAVLTPAPGTPDPGGHLARAR